MAAPPTTEVVAGQGDRCSLQDNFAASMHVRSIFSWQAQGTDDGMASRRMGHTYTHIFSQPPKSFNELYEVHCIINPERSTFLQRWDKIILWAIVFVVLVTPVEVALLTQAPTVDVLFVANTLVDLAFFLDLVLQFCIMYPKYTDHGCDWEVRPSRIAVKYLQTWFAIDAISLAPVGGFAQLLGGSAGQLTLKAIRIVELLKLIRAIRVVRLYRRFQLHMTITYKELALFRFFIIMTILVHWLTCLWASTLIFVGEDAGLPRWIDSLDDVEVNVALKTKHSPWKLYVVCLYFCSYTITSLGYGDIGPRNIVERCVCTFMVIISGIVWAVILGQVSAIVTKMDSDQAFKVTMDDLQLMIRNQRMDDEMRRRLKNFFTANKTAQQRARNHHILESMSPGLRGEVVLHLNREWIAKVYFLFPLLCRAQESDGAKFCKFLAEVAQALHCEVFAQSEVFGSPHVLYILNRGLVSRDKSLYQRGAVWGIDFVLADYTLVDSLQSWALTYVETMTLCRQAFFNVIDAHRKQCPEVQQRIRRTCCWLALQRGIMKEARRRQREETTRTRLTQSLAAAALVDSHNICGDKPSPANVTTEYPGDMDLKVLHGNSKLTM